ncbi:MAG: S28 family serine protease [Bacteroidales bacterium]|nr:S28 family serine protease [Bacteroidales bacterium]MDT8373887.1 S28 family serine protease [Bacteroidales bacterium]
MQRLFFLLMALLPFMISSCSNSSMTLEERLSSLPGATVEKIENDSSFLESYEIKIIQPLDHNNPDGPDFSQQIFLGYAGIDKPVVVVTEGYSARFHKSELARLLDCNQITVEHRYFEDSQPDSLLWTYLTTWQAATDHHRIIELFKPVFRNKWVTTGISKGGQTVMFHSYYYPDDVDARVPYVAPLNFGPEDERVKPFLEQVGTAECRDRIYEFQKLALRKFNILFPMMTALSEERGWTYTRVGGAETAYEMAVLEYEFAFWQWGRVPCDSIPLDGNVQEIFRHLASTGDFFYFSDQGVKAFEPFFYQAMTELGYYGYDFEKFAGLLRYAGDTGNPEFFFSAPVGPDYVYDYEFGRRVDNYIKTEAENFLFLYGEYDPWSSTAADPGSNSRCLKITKEGGAHGTRIGNLSPEQKELVFTKLEEWLDETPVSRQ